jgi:hypothetical protein
MNAKLTALGIYVVATLALPAHAESQSAWILKQMSQSDGSTTTFDNQSTADSRAGEATKSDMKKVNSAAEDQPQWLIKQISVSDGSPTTFDNQAPIESGSAKVKKGAVSEAEDQSEWLVKQLSLSDGNTGYEYKPATDSRFAKAKKSEVKKIAGPAEAAMPIASDSGDGSEAASKQNSRLPSHPEFPVSP